MEDGKRPNTDTQGASTRLARFLQEEKIEVRIGLRAQGHLPTIERMLAAGSGWEEIGEAIHWDPATAERWYRMESDQALDNSRTGGYNRRKGG